MSAAESPQVDEVFLHVGYLRKMGRRRKSWKRRFFVLTAHSLTYFVDASLIGWKGCIWIEDVTSVAWSTAHADKPHCLEISSIGRKTFLMDDDVSVVEGWHARLTTLLGNKVKPSILASTRTPAGDGGSSSDDEA
eukprot:Amastigsp_a841470_129.p3 type:complete len:135 gc:universal Amastigsp_a841470_129:472-68(-)